MIFQEKKSTQIAAYILKRLDGKTWYIKLIKLFYLADRAALLQFGYPLTGDKYFAMPKGPILSLILNLLTNQVDPLKHRYWYSHLKTKGNEISLWNPNINTDELSRAELKIIDKVVDDYGSWDRWKLIDHVMHVLPEWIAKNPKKHGARRVQITLQDVLRHGGKSKDETDEILCDLKNYQAISELSSKESPSTGKPVHAA